MVDSILKLENNQKLKILPFRKDNLYMDYRFFYVNGYNKTFLLDINSPIEFVNPFYRFSSIKNFYLVEYLNKLHIIKVDRTINNIINNCFPSNFNNEDKSKYLLNNSVYLEPKISKVGPYDNYEESKVYYVEDYIINNSFHTQEYKDIISKFDNYIDMIRLENQPFIIKYLDKYNIFKGNYNYLLRSVKINDIRKRKIKTTKTKIWSQVIKMVEKTPNEHIKDIGYLKENENNEEVHQFMVDGYLFEIKLIDKI
jgi:hypothetical protein